MLDKASSMFSKTAAENCTPAPTSDQDESYYTRPSTTFIIEEVRRRWEQLGLKAELTMDDMLKRRFKEAALQRRLCVYLMYKSLDMSYPAIGRIFNHDHTSVMHAHRCAIKIIAADPAGSFAQTAREVEELLQIKNQKMTDMVAAGKTTPLYIALQQAASQPSEISEQNTSQFEKAPLPRLAGSPSAGYTLPKREAKPEARNDVPVKLVFSPTDPQTLLADTLLVQENPVLGIAFASLGLTTLGQLARHQQMQIYDFDLNAISRCLTKDSGTGFVGVTIRPIAYLHLMKQITCVLENIAGVKLQGMPETPCLRTIAPAISVPAR